ncbi:response regulator transcription factor [Stutzerimonas nitrititolerans]|uniref:response regulator transcription factor n=1 Tax=Stutzerimonas nitrititolerans TaxID=2482751 RepID=UPI00289DE2D4|nr:response regulator transcription factor [Stutzerimonas nitrititolerans]
MIDTTTPKIAIIEDNTDLREELAFFLQHKGYSVWSAGSAESFWKKLHRSPADIVLVDLGLPGEDGFSVVDYLNEMACFGLIIITARGDQHNNIRGINLGADLYLVKPVNFAKLASSIDTLWQRMQQESAGTQEIRQSDVTGSWQLVSFDNRVIAPDGDSLKLSQQEYNLLNILVLSPNEVFSKEALRSLMFRHEEQADTHRVDVILSRLRKKARDQSIDLPIRSIFGKGVVFVGVVK